MGRQLKFVQHLLFGRVQRSRQCNSTHQFQFGTKCWEKRQNLNEFIFNFFVRTYYVSFYETRQQPLGRGLLLENIRWQTCVDIPSTTSLRKYLVSMLTFECAHLARECALNVKDMMHRVLLLHVIWSIIKPNTSHRVCRVHDEDCIF